MINFEYHLDRHDAAAGSTHKLCITNGTNLIPPCSAHHHCRQTFIQIFELATLLFFFIPMQPYMKLGGIKKNNSVAK